MVRLHCDWEAVKQCLAIFNKVKMSLGLSFESGHGHLFSNT